MEQVNKSTIIKKTYLFATAFFSYSMSEAQTTRWQEKLKKAKSQDAIKQKLAVHVQKHMHQTIDKVVAGGAFEEEYKLIAEAVLLHVENYKAQNDNKQIS